MLNEGENTQRFQRAHVLEEKAQRYLAGGSLGVFKPPFHPHPVISYGEGSRFTDVNGRSYLDFLMGSGPLILGHSHPAIVSAVERQLRRGTHYYLPGEQIVELAEKIVRGCPCGETVRFTNSGSLATFHALRMARGYTGSEKILKFDGAFHGVNDYSLMTSHGGSYPKAKPESAGIPEAVAESVLVAPFNDTETTAQIIQTHGDSIAAVIVEPLHRVIKPRGTFLKDLRDLTKKWNIVLIFDEIVTGFRLDYGGAQEHYGVVADVVVYGKALTGGLPMGAICGDRRILDTGNPDKKGTPEYCYYGGTLNGDPLAAAAALACLAEVEKEGVLKGFHDRGERFMEEIRDVGRSSGVPLQVVGDGPVFQMFLSEKPIIDYPDTLGQDKEMIRKVAIRMWEKGIMMVPGSKIYLSLAHSEKDLEQFLETLKDTLKFLS